MKWFVSAFAILAIAAFAASAMFQSYASAKTSKSHAQISVLQNIEATSNAVGYDSFECLFSEKCKKGWRPVAKENGNLEEIQFDFLPGAQPEVGDSLLVVGFATNVEANQCSHLVEAFVNGEKAQSRFDGSASTLYCYLDLKCSSVFGKTCGNYKLQSVRLRLGDFKKVPILKRITLVDQKEETSGGENMENSDQDYDVKGYVIRPWVMPLFVKVKSIAASSTGEPSDLYSAVNLFSGSLVRTHASGLIAPTGAVPPPRGLQSLNLQLSNQIDINGVILNNGSAVSKTDFVSHGRIKAATITFNGKENEKILLQDKAEGQIIKFKTAHRRVNQVQLKIESVFPGAKIKDVSLSGLGFLNLKGQVVQAVSPKVSLKARPLLMKWTDRLLRSYGPPSSFSVRLRLRSDGEFSAVKSTVLKKSVPGGETVSITDDVNFYGKWRERPDGIAIAGVRRANSGGGAGPGDEVEDELSTNEDVAKGGSADEVFSAEVQIRSYNEISGAERAELFALLKKLHGWGPTITDAFLRTKNPLIFESPILTDAFDPL